MKLMKLDLSNSNLSNVQIAKVKSATPSYYIDDATFASSFNELPVNILPAEIKVTLQDFKDEYPYSRNMHLLEPIWDKMDMTERVLAVMACKPYKKYGERNSSWYKFKIAAAWLKGKEYLNDWKNL